MTEPVLVLAPNPSIYTGRGTNTYLVGDGPGLLCIDPGPDDATHLEAVLDAAAARGGRIERILLSHSHIDHRPLARALAERTGASVHALEPERADDGARPLQDRERVRAGEVVLEVIATPGHAADHLCFFEPDGGVLYSGDHILGGMTSVVNPPDGDMTAYMVSLERVKALRPRVIHPGHGPRIDDAMALIDEYLTHRRAREAEVERAVRERDGLVAPIDVVPRIYAAYPVALHPVAARSVEAHLDKLAREGRATRILVEGEPRYRIP
ncbi:MAG TPA: MBL fold metallo-hydrolase [Candidatus Dormibacteraeota bacterium]|nr:MBL fold metallo-hydrolase [Candidatus Dormibacteraeota bacterium]